MKILWLNWKDREHPRAGGAELVNEELAKRLVRDGHEVMFLTAGFKGGAGMAERDGFRIIRLGNAFTVYLKAWLYYRAHLRDWADLVIDEVNTVPFFAKFYAKQKNIIFIHQLCREIWFYEMIFPLNIIGWILEWIYLRLLNDRQVVTVSESTKRDLVRFGFSPERISIISEGIDMEPVASLDAIQKYEKPTVLALGEIRPMKRTHQVIQAFELAKRSIPNLELVVAGSAPGAYGQRVLWLIKKSKYADSIRYLGRVTREQKIEVLQKSHILVSAAVKEGWGLTITEANSQGTVAVAYDSDGLRDSIRHGHTGLVYSSDPKALADAMVRVLSDKDFYRRLRAQAWEWSGTINFQKSFESLIGTLNII